MIRFKSNLFLVFLYRTLGNFRTVKKISKGKKIIFLIHKVMNTKTRIDMKKLNLNLLWNYCKNVLYTF